jgi:hypothetical protein
VRWSLSCIVLGALVAIPTPAFAGRTFYGWLYGTEVMPERGVELQTWVLERDSFGPGAMSEKETDLWVGPLVGLTDQLELALPVEFEWLDSDGTNADFTMRRYGAELRYRLVSQDPVEAPPIAPLVRIAAKRDVIVRGATIVEADLVASYQSGRLHALVDLGGVATLAAADEGGSHFQARPGAGVSIKVTDTLRLGGELYGEIDVDDNATRWLAVGPNMAYTQGRFWMSAAYGIGLTGITAAPRVMWGVAF